MTAPLSEDPLTRVLAAMGDMPPTETDKLMQRVRDAEAELARLELTLDVVGTTDLDAGILNRNGVLEALERGRRWMARRGDLYGVLVVRFPGLGALDPESAIDTVRHLAATIGAGLREVDDVGRVSDETFAAALADIRPGSVQIVADRVHELVSKTIGSISGLADFSIGAVEVLTVEHGAAEVLEAGIDLAIEAGDEPILRQL